MRIFFLVLAASVLGCNSPTTVSEAELKAYLLDEEHGLRKKTSLNGVDVEVIYRPSDLLIAQQVAGLTNPTERSREAANFDSLSYFVFKFSRGGQEIENGFVSDNEKFVDVINYLSSGIGGNIYMINDGDTIPALDAVYTRMFGSSSATSVMAVFDDEVKKRTGALSVVLNDSKLGIGQAEFDFDLSDIKKTPTLNLR